VRTGLHAADSQPRTAIVHIRGRRNVGHGSHGSAEARQCVKEDIYLSTSAKAKVCKMVAYTRVKDVEEPTRSFQGQAPAKG
jgi:hypothetical protein